MNPQEIKKNLLIYCQNFVNDRLQRVRNSISDIQESLTSETKSTAGDKHETGRAMLQLEREKAGQQLAETQKLLEILSKIKTDISSERIHLGSLVKTSKADYYIGISIGQVKMNQKSYLVIGANSPIGKLLLGKSKGEIINFNQSEFVIEDIF